MPKFIAKYSQADVDIINREISYSSFLRVDKLQLRHKLFGDGLSDVIHRELLVRVSVVGVLLYDPDRDEVVLVRQFRVGGLNEKSSPWMLELIAGMVDKDEALEAGAIRESAEEADCKVIEIARICDYFNSPGVSDEKVTLFCGKVDAKNAGGIFGLASEHEDIEVVVMASDDAFKAVDSGAINNAMSIIALQWLALNKQELLRNWQ